MVKSARETPKIVAIPPKMEKYFGTGRMLHPDLEMVEVLLRQIPKGQLATVDLLGQKLAIQWSTDITCPMRLENIIKKIAIPVPPGNSDTSPFWRVLKKDGSLIKSQCYKFAASTLEGEGFELDFDHKNGIGVKNYSDHLIRW